MWIKPKDHEVLGAVLSAARKAAGVTQDELAARLEKPQSFVSAYERGQRRIDLLEFLLIVRTLKLDPTEVFSSILAATERAFGDRPRKRA